MQKLAIILFIFILSCGNNSSQIRLRPEEPGKSSGTPSSIREIPVPAGFKRIVAPDSSFATWLRNLKLKKDKTVYLYNGQPKPNQAAQFAVVDIPRSTKDLMQCADVVMKLRAEYLFTNKKFDEVSFTDFTGKKYKWQRGNNRQAFDKYLDKVFGWCGSASLEKQLKPVNDVSRLQAGDVFIKGGFPGHAMIVADIAINEKGEKIFLLVQGYQPAQDIHVVINPLDDELSPWYKIPAGEEVRTPEWVFYKNQLKGW